VSELVDVAENGFATPFIEFGDPVVLDVLLAAETEFPLDREFDGQSVAVPPCLTGHEVPLHRAIAREDVLKDTCFHVVGSGGAVGRGRTLVEGPQGAPLGLRKGALEHRFLIPQIQNLVLHGRQIDLHGHGLVHGASCPNGQDSRVGRRAGDP